jgi:hypothetical protein
MNRPKNAEQRLEVSRALCLQALKQPAWLLIAQRVSVHLTHAPMHPNSSKDIPDLLNHCMSSFFDKLKEPRIRQGQRAPDQQHEPVDQKKPK